MNDQLPDVSLEMKYEDLRELVSVIESLARHDEVEKELRDRAVSLLAVVLKVNADE